MATIGFADAPPVRLEESCPALAHLRGSVRAFLAFSERVSREAGLGAEEYHALLVIRAGGSGVTTSHLAAQLMLGPRATLDLVERLRNAELIERTRDAKDRRRVLVAERERPEAFDAPHRTASARSAPQRIAARRHHQTKIARKKRAIHGPIGQARTA
jgi:DNA-binding MarR family transcriptional regulator